VLTVVYPKHEAYHKTKLWKTQSNSQTRIDELPQA